MLSKAKGRLQTEEILYTIADYCSRNKHIKIWAEKMNSNYRIYIGSDAEFQSQKNNKGNFDEIFEITKDNIFAKCNEVDITSRYRTYLQPTKKFHINFNKEFNEIYAEVFWNNEAETTSIFSDLYLTTGNLNLGTLLKYKRYPEVFSDLTGSAKAVHNDWVKLLATIPPEKFRLMWKDSKILNSFHETLKEIKVSNPEIKPHLFLTNSLKLVLPSIELLNDSHVKISHMLFDILPKNLIKKYTNNLPVLELLNNKKDKETFFKQSDKEIIEKIILEKSEICLYFSHNDLTANEYIHLTEKFFNLISNNQNLKENGLISTDFVKGEAVKFYMTLKENSFINKHFIKDVFIDTISIFINSPEMIEQNVGSLKMFNNELLSDLMNKSIERLLLEKELDTKPLEKTIKRKI